MTPAQVAASLDEPNWLAQWDLLKAADDGFEAILDQWRKWHFTPIMMDGVQAKKKAPSIDGVVALAQMGIMPLRNHIEGQGGLFEEQHDAHAWFVTEGRAWRILGIEDKMLMLNSFGEEKQIDLSRAKWDKYCEAHAAALEAQQKAPGAHA